MVTTVFDPAQSPQKRRAGRYPTSARRSPPPHPAVGAAAATAAVAGLVAVVVLAVATETSRELHLPGGVATFVGSLTGLVGMYLALVMVVLAARVPAFERIIGQDGMLRWHRRLAPWPIGLIVLHALVVTLGYAQAARTGVLHEIGRLVDSYPDMLAATAGFLLLVMIAVASFGPVRRRLRRETWWVMHLYIYLALALSFAHVIALGPAFVGHPLTRIVWSALWALTAGTILVNRFVVPVVRSARYRLRVVEVLPEAPGVVSVVLSGRHLDRLAVSGGQFFAWRFLTRGLWWQAHPYSISALPRPPYVRLTVKQIGDHTAAVARLQPGTRVAFEGPYGAVTAHALRSPTVALVAGGIGITALRSLLEDLPKSSDPVVVMRAATEKELVLHEEVAELVRHRKGTVHTVVGSRTRSRMTPAALGRLVPDIARRDVFVCGPPGLVEDAVAAARRLGVPPSCIHHEIYSW